VAVAGQIGLAMLAGNPLTPSPPPPPPSVAAAPSGGGAPFTGGLTPLASATQPVDWWFAYKFNSKSFPTAGNDPGRTCAFGGKPRSDGFSLKYAFATNLAPTLVDGPGLIGNSTGDPLGATFNEIYNGKYYFVVWNDQFKGDPKLPCGADACDGPWGHSKGMLAWDASGNGVLLQVTTPSWPGAGGADHPRAAGNTLGCVGNDNDASNAQDFFSLKLSRDDVKAVLTALTTASVVTDATNVQIVNRTAGGQPLPADLAALVNGLGKVSPGKTYMDQTLSTGVRMIVKPSYLHVPPWQFVSSVLGGEPLRTGTWWANPPIASTHSMADVHCWDPSLKAPPGEVQVAVNGSWEGTAAGFAGPPNHAKIGVSLPNGAHHYAIFGDLNQQGQLGTATDNKDATCKSSQNGRGGMFFVVDNATLSGGMAKLLAGETAAYPK
jgi:hypothetical protein